MMRIIIVLALVVLLVGCDKFNIVKPEPSYRRYTDDTPDTTNTTQTNTTNSTINDTIEYDFSYYFYPNTLVVNNNESTFVVDAGDYQALSRIRQDDLHPQGMIITLDSLNKIEKAKYFILGAKPEVVYDNGMNTEPRKTYSKYFKYNDKLNISLEVIQRDRLVRTENFDVEVFAPYYHYGLDPLHRDYNSIVVKIEDVLYMSNCYGKCEDRIDAEADYVVLAHNGKCPTNSVEFLLKSSAKTILGDTYCKNMLNNADLDNVSDLRYLGIEFVKLDKDGVTQYE